MDLHARTHAPARRTSMAPAGPFAWLGNALALGARLTPKAGSFAGACLWPTRRARSTIEACGGSRGSE
jgi:hypothetical protein